MKLKKALLLGLSSAVLAIPAFADDAMMDGTDTSATAKTEQKAPMMTKKEMRAKEHRNRSEAKKTETQADMQTINPSEPATN